MGKGKEKSFGLSRSLAWIQEKNFEDKFEVVRVIGYVRPGRRREAKVVLPLPVEWNVVLIVDF